MAVTSDTREGRHEGRRVDGSRSTAPPPPDGGAVAPSPADSAARLRDAGQRVTPQRMLILGALAPGEHLSADEVYARVERSLPAVNRSTVYRTLERFRDLGLVSETDLGGGVREYELLEEGRHHHLICLDCGAMLELDDALVRPLREAILSRHGFAAGIEHLALFGRCAICRARLPEGMASRSSSPS